MNKVSNILTKKSNTENYIPIKTFKEILIQGEKFPYKNVFSLQPLVNDWEARGGEGEQGFTELNDLRKMAEAVNGFSFEHITEESLPELQKLGSCVFPYFFFKNQKGFVGVPFKQQFIYKTPALHDMMSSDLEIKIPDFSPQNISYRKTVEAGIIILNTFYGQELEMPFREIIHLRDKKTGLETHYKFNIMVDYLEPKAVKPLKKLSQRQIQNLLNNMGDRELWLKMFPPENFIFEGFIVGTVSDVTELEILSQLKARLLSEDGFVDVQTQHERLIHLEQQVRSYLKMSHINIGCMQTAFGGWLERAAWSICRYLNQVMELEDVSNSHSTYGEVFRTETPTIIGDLKEIEEPSKLEQELIKLGFRSLLLVPIFNSSNEMIGTLEMTAKTPMQFSNFSLIRMKEVVELFSSAIERSLLELNNRVDLVIKQQFTSIHPSVEWKFGEVASKFMLQRQFDAPNAMLEPIVFKNVFPIYGQADIVSSSRIRNKSIETDLIDNLERLKEVLEACMEAINFHLLDIYLVKVDANLERLRSGAFVSNDESQIVELLTREIHPLLKQLDERFPELPRPAIKAYFDYLDADLEIVYRQRKDYEESVTILNNAMSAYLEKEDQRMQNILPHFFEKYKTDGVEYNIYLGQEILEKGTFSDFFLKDFRLWQLIHMCELTRLVAKTSKELPMPLTTAQLIFVYNNALSIRFRMEEKQFDVDGAYNVRYEILKKRIDKAVIKGTNERLTQKGKIAIVWLQEKDRIEYLEFLHHLLHKGYITEDIEQLELEKLQGAEGLKALRVTVKV